MDRYLCGFVAVALVCGGISMTIRSPQAANRSRENPWGGSPASPGKIFWMRLTGLVMIAGGLFALYATLTGIPGGELIP